MSFSRTQIIATGLVFHVLAAIFSIGYHHCDELFQVYEFAGYKLGLNNASDLPWEFHSQMRSGIQPLIVFGLTKFLAVFSITNPFLIATIVRLLMSLLAFSAILIVTKQFEKEIISDTGKKTLWFLSILFWFMPYFHARFSSENLSATLFLFGMALSLKDRHTKNVIIAGILFGLAFVVRFQLVFMITGFVAWQIFQKQITLKHIFIYSGGVLLALALGMLADKWLYSNWTISWWNYFDQNLLQDKASAFGRQPFYFYLSEALLQLIPPFSLAIVGGSIYFWWRYRYHVITWVTLPFVLLHFFVGHKELRFLFPVLNFLTVMLVLTLQSFNSENRFIRVISGKAIRRFFLIINGIVLIYFTFKPADEISFSLKKIYETVPGDGTLLYEKDDPYGKAAALNFFNKPNVKTQDLGSDTIIESGKKLYYFSPSFSSPDFISKGNLRFKKIYASYPSWFRSLNFNDWQSRSFSFSIYKEVENSGFQKFNRRDTK